MIETEFVTLKDVDRIERCIPLAEIYAWIASDDFRLLGLTLHDIIDLKTEWEKQGSVRPILKPIT